MRQRRPVPDGSPGPAALPRRLRGRAHRPAHVEGVERHVGHWPLEARGASIHLQQALHRQRAHLAQGLRPSSMPTDVALTSLAMPLTEFPAIAREAETRGYRTAWVGEASGTEAIVLSTLIATHTSKLQIANGEIGRASCRERV